ncbi:MAG: DUF4365 domain-containing protein [Xenococcaceae cyanobacterium]
MELNKQKEYFSYAYINTVATAAGYSCEITKARDDYGIDITISGPPPDLESYDPILDVQMKSTSMDVLRQKFIKYPLQVKNYNELRKQKVNYPRILVVVLLPDNTEDWVQQSEQGLLMNCSGYWISLKGEPPTQNKKTVTVDLPRKNLFTVDALKRIMQRIEAGEE